MDYTEIAQRNPRNRHQIIRTQDLRKYINKAIVNKQELYSSYYLYDEEILEHMKTFKTVRSFEGKRYIKTLKFDYDKGLKTDEELLNGVRYFIEILMKDWNVDEYEEIIVWFSGRGYHIEIPNIFRFEPSQYIPDEWTKTAKKYFPEIDTMPFNRVGLFRVPQTVNAKTGLFKVGFTVKQIFSYTASRILQEAIKPQEKNWTIDLETHLDYSKRIVRQEHKRKADSKREEPTQVITCMQHLYNRGSVKGRRHKDMLRMISAWRRAGVPEQLLIIAMKDWVGDDMTDYEVKKNVRDTYNRKYEYGCKDEVMSEFCDPKCRFYKQKNYNVELITSDVAENQFVEFMKMDFKNVAFDLNEIFPMERSFMFFPGEFIMLIGNTKIGKSAVAQNIAIKLKKFPIDYYSLEVGNRLLFRRAVQIEHGYSKEQVMKHYQTNTNTLSQGLEHISMSVISPDLDQLKRKIAERQPKMVIIDPIDGLSVGKLGEFRTREEKLGITLAQMAKDLDVIMFGIHHIPKSAVKDQYGKPKPLDVHSGKGDSALEQKADKVLGFEGEANKTSRILRSLAARDEDPFALSLHYNKKTFRLTKIKELSII